MSKSQLGIYPDCSNFQVVSTSMFRVLSVLAELGGLHPECLSHLKQQGLSYTPHFLYISCSLASGTCHLHYLGYFSTSMFIYFTTLCFQSNGPLFSFLFPLFSFLSPPPSFFAGCGLSLTHTKYVLYHLVIPLGPERSLKNSKVALPFLCLLFHYN